MLTGDLNLDKIPVLNRGCRWREDKSTPALMIPEGMVKLSAGGVRVLRLCDGSKNISQILTELKSQHASDLSQKIEMDTVTFLKRLSEKRVLIFL